MMKPNEYIKLLKEMIPEAKCELLYNKDYELLIATMLSAQTTDKRVNMVTKELFSTYTLEEIANLDLSVLEQIIKPVGTHRKKAYFTKEIAKNIVTECNGKVPNNRKYIESLPGCGHKTCNVVLSNLFDENCVAVDTHVKRVSTRLGFAKEDDDVLTIEKKLEKKFAGDSLKDLHHRMVLFGRYICTAKSPKCNECKFNKVCKEKNLSI